jgi:4-hydroxy-3-methylbut-2-enyl diphosphate reductase
VIDRLRELGAKRVRTLDGVKEHTAFPLPKELSK